MATSVCDVLVVGGGMTGAAMALALAKEDFSVVLVEPYTPSLEWQDDTTFQTRVSALTRASQNLLQQLGAWQGIEARRSHAFTDMHVCEAAQAGSVHFSSKDIGEPNLGYVVENSVIQAALWEQFESYANLQTKQTKVQQIDWQQRQVLFEDGSELTTKLIVGADGAFSQVRDMAGIGLDTHSYDQCAVVGCVRTEQPHLDTCWQRYTDDGPFAYLCMENNISSIAWYLPLEKKAWAESLDDVAFTAAIEEASGGMLGKVEFVQERAAFPLVRRHATHYVKAGLALIGDAAHTIHPQAGQGVNLGFLDVGALSEVLVEEKQNCVESGKDWARSSVLRRYERWRRGDNELVQRSMEVFGAFYHQDKSFLNGVRKVLIPLADKFKPAKNWLVSQALNGRGEMPKLNRSSDC